MDTRNRSRRQDVAARTARAMHSALWFLPVAVLILPGCVQFQVPRIDPTGESVFLQPPVRFQRQSIDEPGVRLAWDPVAVTLSPGVTVAPVDSQVVLVAGVLGEDGFLQTNRRLEWSIAPGGVGYFVDVGRTGIVDVLLGDFNNPRKVDNTFAVGSTLRQRLRLERGTPDTGDDVCVARGQGWASLTSPVEGTTLVTVYAPEVHTWQCRARTATIHWIDAQFDYPPPSINRSGTTHPLTTTVTRPSDGSPLVGWIVRYQITGGPPAGLGPEATQTVEVLTDASGQATAELVQTAAGPGTNTIRVEVFRPGGAHSTQQPTGPNGIVPGVAGRLLVGSTTVTKTWTAASLTLDKAGPAVGTIGATLTYQITVANPGDMPAEGVLVTDHLPEGVEYVASQPAAEVSGRDLTWQIGRLEAGERRLLELSVRADQPGTITTCAEAAAAGGLSARGCATTQLTAGAALDVKINGPREASVGEQVRFEVVITNHGQAPTGVLLIKDRYDEGFEHEVADPERTIEADLGSIEPGESQQVNIDFTVARPGSWCHTVEVLDPSGARATAEACLDAQATPGAETGPEIPGQQPPGQQPAPGQPAPDQPPPAGQAQLRVTKRGPVRATVGQMTQFVIDVTNAGQTVLSDVRVVDEYDSTLAPKMATDGYQSNGNQLTWVFRQLRPGEATRVEVRCECLRTSQRTCNRVEVTASEGAQANDEVCFPINAGSRPPATGGLPPTTGAPGGGLTITATDLHDPIAVGKEMTYVVQVTNAGTVPQRQVAVTATVPQGMTPVRLGTTGPRKNGGILQARFAGQQVIFPPMPEVAPGRTMIYRIRVRTQQPGQMAFTAEATSEQQPQPLRAQATTQVNPGT